MKRLHTSIILGLAAAFMLTGFTSCVTLPDDDNTSTELAVFNAITSSVQSIEKAFRVWVKRSGSSGTLLEGASDEGSDASVLPHFLNLRRFEEADSGWYYHMTKRAVLIKYRNPGCDYRLRVSFEMFDLIGM